MIYEYKGYNPMKFVVTIFLSVTLLYSGQLAADTGTAKINELVKFQLSESVKSKPQTMQWTMKAAAKGKLVVSGGQYQLVNLAINQGLGHQKRTLGANLGFLSSTSTNMNMLIQKQQGSGQIRYGDTVALNLKPYGWLRYKKQGWTGGINLGDDDNNPHFIWEIRGATKGTKLVSGMPFALFNTSPLKKEVIYCGRTSGIDLGWFNDTECGGFISKMSGLAFGKNGLLAGASGKALKLARAYICDAAVSAAAGATATPVVLAAAALAREECKNR